MIASNTHTSPEALLAHLCLANARGGVAMPNRPRRVIQGQGSLWTDILGPDGGFIELHGRTVKELSMMLNDRGLISRPSPTITLTERSAIRTPWKPEKVRLPKVIGRDLDRSHEEYRTGVIEFSEFVDQMYYFLAPRQLPDAVQTFLAENSEALEAGSFWRLQDGSFSRFLKKTWMGFLADNQFEAEEILPQGIDEPAEVKLAPTRPNIEAAFRRYLAREQDAEDKLYDLVIRFATMRAEHKMFDVTEHESTPSDAGQEATIAAWEGLPTFKGTPPQFYPWLWRICTAHAVDGFKANLRTYKARVPLFVEDSSAPGLQCVNPAIFR